MRARENGMVPSKRARRRSRLVDEETAGVAAACALVFVFAVGLLFLGILGNPHNGALLRKE
jgi:hypothetical protein